MRKRRRRGPGPIGTIVLIWVFFAIILPLVRLSGGLITRHGCWDLTGVRAAASRLDSE